jgi:hypothetical protein
MSAPLSRASRWARALYVYVAVVCGLVALALPWTDLDHTELIALGRLLLFVVGGIAGGIGITRRRRGLRYTAAGIGGIALLEFVVRLPTLMRQHDVAVANAGWFAFLGANSVFVALAVAGYLSLTGGRPTRNVEPRGAA